MNSTRTTPTQRPRSGHFRSGARRASGGVLLLSLLVGACGGSDQGADEPEADQAATNQTDAAPDQSVESSDQAAPTPSYLDAPPLGKSPVQGLVQQALALAKSERHEEAERLLRRAREQAPNQPEVALLLGQVLIEQSQIEMGYQTTDRGLANEGIAFILGVAAVRPDDVPTQLILGRSYCLAKDADSASPVLRHVLSLDPGNVHASRLLGALRYEAGFAAEAEALLPPLDSVDERDFELLKLWGMVLEDQDRFEEARVAYERAVAGSPFEHRPRFKLASVLATLGLDQEADVALESYSALLAQKGLAKSLEDAASKATESSELWVQAGIARLSLDNSGAALRNFGRAVRANPTSAEALTWLGVTHAKQESFGEAIGALKEAVRLAPELLKARRGLGEVLLARGEFDAALLEFDAALKLVPAAPEGLDVHPETTALKALIERARAARDSKS